MSQMTYVLNTSSAQTRSGGGGTAPKESQFPYQQPSTITTGTLQTGAPYTPPRQACEKPAPKAKRSR